MNNTLLAFFLTSTLLHAAPVETVTSLNDFATGSFRTALANVDDNGTILFDPSLNGATASLFGIIDFTGEDTFGPDPISKSVTIDASSLGDGITLDGGSGIRFIEVLGDHEIVCKNITFRNGRGTTPETPNPSRNTRGGAIVLRSGGFLTLENCNFLSCSTTTGGGAIFAEGATTIATNCTFANNSATNDGGAFHNNGSGIVQFTNCTFDNNSAGALGGALNHSAGTDNGSFLTHCTLTDNTAPTGGAIRIATNSGNILPLKGCLLAGTSNAIHGSADLQETLVRNTSSDTVIPLGNYEGQTFTRPLANGSPASKRVNTLFEPLDQWGASRTLPADYGAVEGGRSVIVTTLDDEDDGTTSLDFINLTDVSLREAVKYGGDGSIITFDPSLALGTISISSSQEMMVAGDVTIDASSAGGITIDASASTSSTRIFNIEEGSADDYTFTLKSLTLTGGSRFTTGADTNLANPLNEGGAIRNSGGRLLAFDCIFDNNEAKRGGAILSSSSDPLTFTRCTFSNNDAIDGFSGRGGSLHLRGADATFDQCEFSPGSSSGDGGYIYTSGFDTTLTDCRFLGGTAGEGGALYAIAFSNIIGTNCFFAGQSTTDGSGAIYLDDGDIQFTNCSLSGNQTDGSGGAVTHVNSTASYHSCTFSGNSASGFSAGGAVENFNSSPAFTACVIWNNSSNSSTTSPAASINDRGTSASTFDTCLIENFALTSPSLDGTDPDNDPLFMIPVDPTTAPTQEGFLRPGGFDSPINGEGIPNGTTTDVLGRPRIANGTQEMGAYEFARAIWYINDNVAAGDESGDSWTNAIPSLTTAIEAAQPGDILRIAEGFYTPETPTDPADPRTKTFLIKPYLNLTGGYPDINPSFETNPVTHPTVLSGDLAQDDDGTPASRSENAYHVVTNSNHSRIIGLIFTQGNANGSFPHNEGGGILSPDSAGSFFQDCFFLANEASRGAGGHFSEGEELVFANCVFSGNKALLTGGGLYLTGDSDSYLLACTFSGNSANSGGGLLLADTSAIFSNSLIWGNSDSVALSGNALSTYHYSLVEGLNPSGSTNLDGTLASNDPLFVAPTLPSAAPTQAANLRLSPGSPVVDEGFDSIPQSGAPNTRVFTDIAQNERPDDQIDIGAYELQVDDFLEDTDGDGLANGLELAIGNDPNTPDADSERTLSTSLNASGNPQFEFGYDPAQSSAILLKLTRSLDLITFTDVITSDDASFPVSGGAQQQIILLDPAPPAGGKAFYRLKAEEK